MARLTLCTRLDTPASSVPTCQALEHHPPCFSAPLKCPHTDLCASTLSGPCRDPFASGTLNARAQRRSAPPRPHPARCDSHVRAHGHAPQSSHRWRQARARPGARAPLATHCSHRHDNCTVDGPPISCLSPLSHTYVSHDLTLGCAARSFAYAACQLMHV